MPINASAAAAAPSGDVRQSCLSGVHERLPDAIRLGAQAQRLLGSIPPPANDVPLVETQEAQDRVTQPVSPSRLALITSTDSGLDASKACPILAPAADTANCPTLPPALIKKKRTPKPYVGANSSCRFRDLDQEGKLKLYHEASRLLPTPPNFYIVNHVLDVDVEGKESGRWMGLAGRYLLPVLKRVFASYRDDQGHRLRPTYLYVWDIVRLDERYTFDLPDAGVRSASSLGRRPGHGLMSVNIRYGLHFDLVLYVPPALESRLHDVLWDLARKRHLQAASARGVPEKTIRACLHKALLTHPGSGLSIHCQRITDSAGGLDGLLAGYFPKHLRSVRKLAPVRGLALPRCERTQLVFASADFRKFAQRRWLPGARTPASGLGARQPKVSTLALA